MSAVKNGTADEINATLANVRAKRSEQNNQSEASKSAESIERPFSRPEPHEFAEWPEPTPLPEGLPPVDVFDYELLATFASILRYRYRRAYAVPARLPGRGIDDSIIVCRWSAM